MDIYDTAIIPSKNFGYDLDADVTWPQLETWSLDKHRVIKFVFLGEEIHLNGEIQTILAKNSSVFQAMFEGEQQEVFITDMDPDTFKWMLLYIHGSELPGTKKEFDNLLAAAEKYQLYKLNSLRMISSMTQANWIEIMKQAQLSRNLELVDALFEFFMVKANTKHIYESKEFQDLYSTNEQFNVDFSSAIRFKGRSRVLRFQSHYSMLNSTQLTEINIEENLY